MEWVTARPNYDAGTLHRIEYGGREIGVRTVPNSSGTAFVIHRLGVWSREQGRPAYTKVTPPTGTYGTELEAVEQGVALAKSRIDGGLA